MDGFEGADGFGVGALPAAAVAFEAEGFAFALGRLRGSFHSTVGPLPKSRPAAVNSR